jgi:hypothetical protein
MPRGQCTSACDRGSYSTLVSHWMGDQKFLSQAPPCLERYVKPLVPAAFAVVGTHQLALGVDTTKPHPHGGLWPVLLT